MGVRICYIWLLMCAMPIRRHALRVAAGAYDGQTYAR